MGQAANAGSGAFRHSPVMRKPGRFFAKKIRLQGRLPVSIRGATTVKSA